MAQRTPQGADELVAQAWSTVEEVLGEVLGGLLDGMLPGLHRRTSMRMYSEIYDAVNQPREGAWVAEQLYSNLSLWLNDFVPRRIAATLVDLCRSGQELKLCRTVIEYYNKYQTFSRFFCIVFNYVNKAYPPQGTSLEAMFHDAFTRSVHKDVQRPLLTSVQEDWTTCDVGCTSWLARWLEDDAALELMDEAALELMRTAVQAHIVAEGRALIAAFESEVSAGPFSLETSIVTKLMELHAEFGQLIGHEFEESRELLTACKRSFAHLLTSRLTRNDPDPSAGEGAVKTRETSFPELLATYCEAVMKRETNARDPDQKLGELLSYMKENDVFSRRFIDIIKHPETGCGVLLGDGKTSDLGRMYRLVKYANHDAALELMRTEVQARIEAEGRTLIAGFESEVSTGPLSLETPFVTKVMGLSAKYGDLIKQLFEGSNLFHVNRKVGFTAFLKAKLTRRDPKHGQGALETRETSFPEVLATYCDAVMRRVLKDVVGPTVEMEHLDELLTVFTYVTEKDVFQEYYKLKLSKRLLQTTPFEDLEKAFLERLQREMGKSYTHKLEGMLLDLESSKNTLRTFKTDVASAGLGTDFNVNVLGAANWPAYKPDSMVPPAQLRRCVEAFQRCFAQQNATKKLTWIHLLGQATMSVSFPKGSKEVSASLYQASVLLTIDTMATATPKGVAEALSLDMTVVKHLIASMFVSKSYNVLRRVDASGETVITTDKPFGDDDLFALNRDFTFKTRKFKLVAPSASSAADVFTEPGIDERRRIHVDAAVVRIMKSRRTLSYTELEDLVITQLSKQFVPQPKLIKLRVDDLITREYLRRHDGDRNSLEYLA
jgi:hypothetical protein